MKPWLNAKDLEDLKNGDALMVRTKSIGGAIIRLRSHSPWNHVGIIACTNFGKKPLVDVIEAVMENPVHRKSIYWYLAQPEKYTLSVYRNKRLDDLQRRNFVNMAMIYVGEGYDTRGLLGFNLIGRYLRRGKKNPFQKEELKFCSELYTLVMKKFTKFLTKITDPAKAAPGDIPRDPTMTFIAGARL